jgi:hypothetical protein
MPAFERGDSNANIQWKQAQNLPGFAAPVSTMANTWSVLTAATLTAAKLQQNLSPAASLLHCG